jgi:hypothetical protein
MNTKEVETALVRTKKLFTDCEKNVVVPNISFGLKFNHELDLLVLSKSGFITEVEIKVSRADLIKDFDKPHHHKDARIKFLYYAAPEEMEQDLLELVSANCGIIVVKTIKSGRNKGKNFGVIIRKAQANAGAKKITPKEKTKLFELMLLRFWNLKAPK